MTQKEALAKAGACWCDPTVSDKTVDMAVSLVFAELLRREVNKAFQEGKDSQYRAPKYHWSD